MANELNRIAAPEFKTIDEVHLQEAAEFKLDNGVTVFELDAGTQDVVKVEFIYPAGSAHADSPVLASAVNDMLDEGTPTRQAEALAEELDFYGAFIESEVTPDLASFTLYTLNKHIAPTLEIVSDVLYNASFPDAEFEVYRSNSKQRFIVDSGKVNVLARRRFGQLLFGNEHPYGKATEIKDYDNLTTAQLRSYFNSHYAAHGLKILVAGKIEPELRRLLNTQFGQASANDVEKDRFSRDINTTAERIHTVEKSDAIQSAIRIGRPLFNREHEHFPGMQILNTVLGGYFGSRLMANIREDKGYTYGIGSGLASMNEHGYFFISTEVGVDVTSQAIVEIYKEIKQLREELIPHEELELVRNYMIGTFLRSTDGPFALADRKKALIGYDLDYSYYERYFETVKCITPAELRDLANLYWQEEDLIDLVAGKRN